MKTKELNLYKVYEKEWSSPAYVAAENQQQAVDKVAPYYEIEDSSYLSVEYSGNIIV
jgi:hypothetical protein